MSETDNPTPADEKIVETYVEVATPPVAGGRWEILADDTVRYIRPDGTRQKPAIVAANTLRTSPTWRRLH